MNFMFDDTVSLFSQINYAHKSEFDNCLFIKSNLYKCKNSVLFFDDCNIFQKCASVHDDVFHKHDAVDDDHEISVLMFSAKIVQVMISNEASIMIALSSSLIA